MKILRSLLIVVISLLVISGCTSGLRTTLDILRMDRTDTVNVEWLTSDIIKQNPYEPEIDQQGMNWSQFSYMTDSWQHLRFLPDKDWGCNNCDRYYRGYFYVSQIKTFFHDYGLYIQSDEGIWIYVNGKFIGHLSGDVNKQGCINLGWNCWDNRDVNPFKINDYLIKGKT